MVDVSRFIKLYYSVDEIVSKVKGLKYDDDEIVIGEFDVEGFVKANKDKDEYYVRYNLLYKVLEDYFKKLLSKYFEFLGTTGEDDNITVLKTDGKLVALDVALPGEYVTEEKTLLIVLVPVLTNT